MALEKIQTYWSEGQFFHLPLTVPLAQVADGKNWTEKLWREASVDGCKNCRQTIRPDYIALSYLDLPRRDEGKRHVTGQISAYRQEHELGLPAECKGLGACVQEVGRHIITEAGYKFPEEK